MNTLALFGFAIGLALVSLANAAARDVQSRLERAGRRQKPYSSPRILLSMTREYRELAGQQKWSLWPPIAFWTFGLGGCALCLVSALVLI